MRRILTSVLTLSWASVFGLLTIGVLPSGGRGSISVFDLLGLDAASIAATAASHELIRYLLALFFLSAAVLFFWAFAVSLADRAIDVEGGDDVNRAAFATGAGALMLGLVGGTFMLVPGLFTIAMVSLAALVVSYVATFLERLSLLMSSEPGAGDIRAAARLMALGAAHSSMLSRISGRETPHGERGTR